MKTKTVLTIGLLAAAGVAAYVVYKHYNPTASKKNNTVLTDIGVGLAVAPGVINTVSSWFKHGSNSTTEDAATAAYNGD